MLEIIGGTWQSDHPLSAWARSSRWHSRARPARRGARVSSLPLTSVVSHHYAKYGPDGSIAGWQQCCTGISPQPDNSCPGEDCTGATVVDIHLLGAPYSGAECDESAAYGGAGWECYVAAVDGGVFWSSGYCSD